MVTDLMVHVQAHQLLSYANPSLFHCMHPHFYPHFSASALLLLWTIMYTPVLWIHVLGMYDVAYVVCLCLFSITKIFMGFDFYTG